MINQAVASKGYSVPDSDDIDFGNKDFSITMSIPTRPITIYINKVFKCPTCGCEAEHSTNLDGEPTNKPFCPTCFRKANIPIMELKEEET